MDQPDTDTDGDNFSSDDNSDYVFSDDSYCGSDTENEDKNDSHYANTIIENENLTEICESSTTETSTDPNRASSSIFTGRRHLAMCPEYRTLGPPTVSCRYCNAIMWDMERVNKSNRNVAPLFSMCCGK